LQIVEIDMQKSLAVISDIHANFEALSAVISDFQAQGVTEAVCLGDIVGYASGVNSCVRKIRKMDFPALLGNHDAAACFGDIPEEFNDTATAGAIYAARQLSAENKYWLLALPRVLTRKGITFVHASLADDVRWPYIVADKDAAWHFAAQETRIAFCGHTHKPLIWTENSPVDVLRTQPSFNEPMQIPDACKVLINVGSVGQPRDGDARACYVIYSPQQNSLEFRRVPYNFKTTRRKILRAKLPLFSAQRLALGR
jgi:diadenosine tetraphosphatase ApaH/serine/threonine PP2A family protein phosphatase